MKKYDHYITIRNGEGVTVYHHKTETDSAAVKAIEWWMSNHLPESFTFAPEGGKDGSYSQTVTHGEQTWHIYLLMKRADVMVFKTVDGQVATVSHEEVVRSLENYYNVMGKRSLPWFMHSTVLATMIRDIQQFVREHRKGDGRIPEWFSKDENNVPFV